MKWMESNFPGVRYREHKNRIFKRQKDKYFLIRYWRDGKTISESLGWLSEGMTAQKASQLRGEILQNIKVGKRPQSIAQMREMEAERKAAEEESRRLAEIENFTFGEGAEHFLKWSEANKRSHKADRSRYENHLKKSFGAFAMKDISTFHLEKLKSKMKKSGLTDATLTQVLQLVRAIYRKAITWGLYQGDIPTLGVKFPKLNNERKAFLTVEQVNMLLDEIKPRSFPLWCQTVLAVFSGLRFGEIAALAWRDVDIENGIIQIRTSKSGYDREAYITEPIHEMLGELLSAGERSDLLFPGKNGEKQNRVSPTFYRIVDELKLNKGVVDKRQKVVFHSLRHTFGSHLAMAGVPITAIKELMGHETLEMTLRYAHLMPNRKREAATALARSFEKKDKVIEFLKN